tara:strand:- start:1926 stop:3728 length:1803 start_codon:yes stop_codon:yes gene_type:complete
MVVNESFLDSATVRENVVSLARNIGYVPRSKTAAKAEINIQFTNLLNPDDNDNPYASVFLKEGLICTGTKEDSTYSFSIPQAIENSNITSDGVLNWPVTVYQGTYLTKTFTVDGSLDQRFILDNSDIDTSTIVVYVNIPTISGDYRSTNLGKGTLYTKVDNILNIDKDSETYLIQEVQDEKWELLFGDGIFGKKLENETKITVQYIVTDGSEGNGPGGNAGAQNIFSFAGTLQKEVVDSGVSERQLLTPTIDKITTLQRASNGGDIESINSIKYFAPRLYSSQYRAVTSRDYESIIQQIYPNTESVSVVGGEEMDPPQFGTVFLTIKPKNGDFVSDFDKEQILSDLKGYSLTGINQKILDLKVLYIELENYTYYNAAKVGDVAGLRASVVGGLTTYANSLDINKFGGRFRYSKILSVIDNIDDAITSNITRVKIRRNLNSLINQNAQYELCFGNEFNVKESGLNIKSTGFKIQGTKETVYLSDTPNADKKTGVVQIIRKDRIDGSKIIVVEDAGNVDYVKGEIILTTINITDTDRPNNIIEVQAFPESNDIIGLQDLYLKFSIGDSAINMVKDTITSGEQISGVGYKVTSSYTNGDLIRT